MPAACAEAGPAPFSASLAAARQAAAERPSGPWPCRLLFAGHGWGWRKMRSAPLRARPRASRFAERCADGQSTPVYVRPGRGGVRESPGRVGAERCPAETKARGCGGVVKHPSPRQSRQSGREAAGRHGTAPHPRVFQCWAAEPCREEEEEEEERGWGCASAAGRGKPLSEREPSSAPPPTRPPCLASPPRPSALLPPPASLPPQPAASPDGLRAELRGQTLKPRCLWG